MQKFVFFFSFLIDPASFCKKWLHHRLEILTKLIITKIDEQSFEFLITILFKRTKSRRT